MARLAAAFLVILISSFAALAQTAPDAAGLTRMLNEFLDGASRNDPAAHDKFWADDLIYTRSTGFRTTKAEIMKGLAAPHPIRPDEPVPAYSAEDIQIHQYGAKFAVVAFRLMIKTTDREGQTKVSSNLNTGVFLRRNGVWRVVAWQSTVAAETKPASKPSGAESSATGPEKTTLTSDTTHNYQKGARGGCYFLNATGGKVYVDHKYCQ
jgi:hypothetical protein